MCRRTAVTAALMCTRPEAAAAADCDCLGDVTKGVSADWNDMTGWDFIGFDLCCDWYLEDVFFGPTQYIKSRGCPGYANCAFACDPCRSCAQVCDCGGQGANGNYVCCDTSTVPLWSGIKSTAPFDNAWAESPVLRVAGEVSVVYGNPKWSDIQTTPAGVAIDRWDGAQWVEQDKVEVRLCAVRKATFRFNAGDKIRVRQIGAGRPAMRSIDFRDCQCPTKSPVTTPTAAPLPPHRGCHCLGNAFALGRLDDMMSAGWTADADECCPLDTRRLPGCPAGPPKWQYDQCGYACPGCDCHNMSGCVCDGSGDMAPMEHAAYLCCQDQPAVTTLKAGAAEGSLTSPPFPVNATALVQYGNMCFHTRGTVTVEIVRGASVIAVDSAPERTCPTREVTVRLQAGDKLRIREHGDSAAIAIRRIRYRDCGCTEAPTAAPTRAPTLSPVRPTVSPSFSPTSPPTVPPTDAPLQPTSPPSPFPSVPPTASPSNAPLQPTEQPSPFPSTPPTLSPTAAPLLPTAAPSPLPSAAPSSAPSAAPLQPTAAPSRMPSASPTAAPSDAPLQPTAAPSRVPSLSPSSAPSASPLQPTDAPSVPPSPAPSSPPTQAPIQPTDSPTSAPQSSYPTLPPRKPGDPSHSPVPPSTAPSTAPSTSLPSTAPTDPPSRHPVPPPTQAPSTTPSAAPSAPPVPRPTGSPSVSPSRAPSASAPTRAPSVPPSTVPTPGPTQPPSTAPSAAPSHTPSSPPSPRPSAEPTVPPSWSPSARPSTAAPSGSPASTAPSLRPSVGPSAFPSPAPSPRPSARPASLAPSSSPSAAPSPRSVAPSHPPQHRPSAAPTVGPTAATPSGAPTTAPSHAPTVAPTASPHIPIQPAASVAEGAVEVGATGAMLGASAVGAAQVGRLSIILAGCTSGSCTPADEPLAPSVCPLALPVDFGAAHPRYIGCVLGSFLIVACCFLLHSAAYLVAQIALKKKKLAARGMVRFPTGSAIVAAALSAPTTFVGAKLLRCGDATGMVLGVISAACGFGVGFGLLHAGRKSLSTAVYKLDGNYGRQGLWRWVLGRGEWLSLPLEGFRVERWAVAFRSALPGLQWVLGLDVLLGQIGAVNGGLGGGSCALCAVERMIDTCLALGVVFLVVTRQPYSRTLRHPVTVVAQLLLAAGALALAIGYLAESCPGDSDLPGHHVAPLLLMMSAFVQVFGGAVDCVASLRSMQVGRRAQLRVSLDKYATLGTPGCPLTKQQLRSGLERVFRRRFEDKDFDALWERVDEDGSGDVSVREFLMAEDFLWEAAASAAEVPDSPAAATIRSDPGGDRGMGLDVCPLLPPVAPFATFTSERSSTPTREGTGADSSPPCITLSGAGLPEFNGMYVPEAGTGSRLQKVGGGAVLARVSSGGWAVTKTRSAGDGGTSPRRRRGGVRDQAAYFHPGAGDGALPPLAGWAVGPAGVGPAPVGAVSRLSRGTRHSSQRMVRGTPRQPRGGRDALSVSLSAARDSSRPSPSFRAVSSLGRFSPTLPREFENALFDTVSEGGHRRRTNTEVAAASCILPNLSEAAPMDLYEGAVSPRSGMKTIASVDTGRRRRVDRSLPSLRSRGSELGGLLGPVPAKSVRRVREPDSPRRDSAASVSTRLNRSGHSARPV
eukprot:TRINITY_DN42947_c0_g1_i1.p1 TRINITY_DN42947_c0_g1~~TRINITY_DN42947_c0_g1_i1.p1  ORF type:complete len:1628 (+),score=269.84 TRINITY_DN42947_c0_g1_i1:79-4962(+)